MTGIGTLRRLGTAVGAALLTSLAVLVPAPAASADTADRPVVLIGVAGLSWSDVEDSGAELIASLDGGDAALGSLVVRSTTATACPADGWLAISAGNRTNGGRDATDACLPPRGPVDDGDPIAAWDSYLVSAAAASYASEPGLLGDTLAAAGITATAIGDGAALALATSDGRVARYEDRVAEQAPEQVGAALADSDLVVVDLGDDLAQTEPDADQRPDAIARAVEEIVGIVEAANATGRDPVILISGLSDDSGPAALRVLATIGLGQGTLSSPSTRQPGYVLATDQHATLLDLLGVDHGVTTSIGAAVEVTGSGAGTTALVSSAVDRERHASAQRPLIPGFFLGLVLLNLALYAAVTIGLRRTRVARSIAERREPVLRALRTVALTIAAIPVASSIANLAPWWRFPIPVIGLLAAIAVVVGAIVLLALRGPWRRLLLGPAAAVALVTAAVLALDVITGARLQVSGIMGFPTLVAGRSYGMSNTTFALFAASSILVATVVANQLVHRGRRGQAALAVAGIGAVAIAVDGAPFWGADFGGPPALLIAFALLALLAAGVRLTVRRVVVIVLAAGLATMAIAFLDWLRPESSRTHLGRFFETVVEGDVWPVIGRKLDQNLTILLGNRPLTILAICGVLLVIFVLIRPVKETITAPDGGEYAWLSRGAPISAMARTLPMLRPGLIALAVASGVGFAVNDSGIAIPALAVAVAVPLLLASCATWMLGEPERVETAPDGGSQAP